MAQWSFWTKFGQNRPKDVGAVGFWKMSKFRRRKKKLESIVLYESTDKLGLPINAPLPFESMIPISF